MSGPWYIHTSDEGVKVTKGGCESYPFKTIEWAELCARSLNRLEPQPPSLIYRALGRYDTLTGANVSLKTVYSSGGKEVVRLSNTGTLEKFDLPFFVGFWWRGTTVYRAWRVLMWGEKA